MRLALIAVLGVACSQPATKPGPPIGTTGTPPPSLDAAPGEPVPDGWSQLMPLRGNYVTDYCESDMRQALQPVFDAVPKFDTCQDGVLNKMISFTLGGHDMAVVHQVDERSSWVDGPVTYDAAVIVDGARIEPARTFTELWKQLGASGPVDAHTAEAGAQALVLALWPKRFAIGDIDNARKHYADSWPDAFAMVERDPPGIRSNGDEHEVRLWLSHGFSNRGSNCRFVSRLDLQFKPDGTIEASQTAEYAQGERLGEPCGDPVPAT
jgi:hypothetical protein